LEKILIFIISGLRSGGAEKMLLKLCSSLEPKSRPELVICLTSTDNSSIAKDLNKLVEVYSLELDKTILNFVRVFKVLRKCRNKNIVSWMYHADLLSSFIWFLNFGKNNVFWNIRNGKLPPFRQKLKLNLIVRILIALSYLIPHKIICCSKVSILEHARIGYCKNKFVLIPNMIDLHLGIQRPYLRSYTETKKYIISLVARFDIQKNIEQAIIAVNHVKSKMYNVELWLIGDGLSEENKQLHALLSKHDKYKCVKLLGFRKNLKTLYENTDILFLPSIYGEGFPNVLLEGLQLGKCALISKHGDGKDLYSHSDFILNELDGLSMGEKLIKLINTINNDKQKIESRINSMQRQLDRFKPLQISKEYMDCFKY
tara:strand:- start:2554 stop:3666 length:1113 start_codon:yes stop_codon:yes gene_type:complete